MKRTLPFVAMLLLVCSAAFAQRHTDRLDRGLVAVPTGAAGNSNSNLVTWRRLADEYSGVTYNLYKNGARVASNLNTTSYNDGSNAPASTSYQVAAVVNGVEQAKCAAITPWAQYVYNLVARCATGYLDIDLAKVYDRAGNDVTAHYELNDAEMADLDGDGQLEIIVKRLNTYDAGREGGKGLYEYGSKEFVVLDAYDVNWQTGAATLMWRVDCGPNMVSLNSTEIDIIAYDWDEDGKAEVVLRGADNMLILGSDGKTKIHTVGNASVNTRNEINHDNDNFSWTHTGAEYLIYMNGQTGALYQQMDYPLTRESAGAWGDEYGHRSSKYFMGAPFLDGRTACLFLARGIYTRHKMIAMNLNKGSHQWSERWRWNNNTPGSPWYGNGYHNFVIADVDEDGRDEIVYGSMVIDDNGRGLSTSGLGHGDAQHVGDLDPYRKGLEFFGCNEDKPAMNYRNATTSELYVRLAGGSDDGRALMDNFSNSYPGSQGRSVSSGLYSSVADKTIGELGEFIAWGDLNFRIYWDGDLCSEVLNSPGTAKEAKVEKPGVGRLFTSSGCNMNNDSKNNPCFQGDIIGDWREEIVLRRGAGLRIYTSGMGTSYSLPCLWFDHQYRQAMVWQMMAYNQPPHVSYFVGEMEGLTQAPPPLTNSGRTEINDGGTISTTADHLMMAKTGNMTVSVANGAAPRQLTVNTPSWVQGNDNNSNITTTYYTHTLTGGAFSGSMSLTKQGDGLLVMPNVTEAYTGKTDVWAGSLAFSGTLSSSPVWMNRHTKLIGAPTISNALTMEYGATFSPSAAGVTDAAATSYATANIATLNMHEGSRMLIQIDPANGRSDKVNIGTLNLRTRSGDAWTNYGPRYLKPVIQIAASSSLGTAKAFTLGTLEALTVDGAPVSASRETPIGSVVLEGAGEGKLYYYDGKLILLISGTVEKVVLNCDFNHGETLFAGVSRMTVDNDNNARFTCASNSQNAYSLATYDFSSAIGNDAKAVKIEFLYWIPNQNAAYRRLFTVGQADLRTGFGKNGYSTAGSMFAFGLARNSSANYFSINGASTTAAASAGNVLGTWARAEIYVDHTAKTVNYKITNIENTQTYYSANGIAFVDGTASYCNQLDFFDCQNSTVSYLDNLVITKYADVSLADYTVKYVSTIDAVETEIKPEEIRSGLVDEAIALADADKDAIIYKGHQYYYVSDNASTSTIKNDNSTVVKVVFAQAAFSGDCYLRNKATGAYLAAGNNWGTQAVTNNLGGHRVGFEVLPQGKYRLNTYIYRDQNPSSDLHYLKDNFCDGEAQEWQITDAGSGYYTLSNETGKLTGGAVDAALSITSGTGDNTKWQILTAAERKAEIESRMAEATPENGVDATFYITAPGFAWADVDDRAAWQGSPVFGGFDNGSSGRFWNAERYTDPYAAFDVWQALTGMKPGIYKLTVQGYYRNGFDNASNANDHLAKLYANSTEVPLKNIRYYGYTDNTHSAEGFTTNKSDYFVPNSQTDAAKTFNAGYYGNELYVVVGEDGNLRIGVKKTAASGADKDWACFDNFQLTYYGNTVSVALDNLGYATFASPYALDLTNLSGGAKAYKAAVDEATVTFSAFAQSVPANTGMLLKGGANAVVNIPVVASGSAVTDNVFLVNESGTTFTGESGYDYFAMKKNQAELTFGLFDPSTVAMPSNKAYLKILDSVFPGEARVVIHFDDPTDIDAVEAAETGANGLKDGKYLIGNKIIIVKNGVKYGVNGQTLNSLR